MLSISAKLSAAQAATYFQESYSRDDYYSDNRRCVGRWMSQGAAALDLAGDVSREDFAAVLEGRDPRGNKELLIASATHNGKHIGGWDAVFSAPKSITIQALLEDPRLVDAHTRAVERAFQAAIEPFALALQNGGARKVITGNVVAAAFNHEASRPTKDSPDPQLHTHVVLANMTLRGDGKWRALYNREIFRSQQYATAIYRTELARDAQQLGYEIEVTDAAKGEFELKHYTPQQLLNFSRRRQEIERAMNENGWSGAKAQQIIALQTRRSKASYEPSELLADWCKRALEYGIDTGRLLANALKRGNIFNGQTGECAAAVAYAREHLSERLAVFDRRALEAVALRYGVGRVDLAGIRGEVALLEQQGKLIRSREIDARHPEGSFTTPEAVRLEQENLRLAERGKNHARPIGGSLRVRAWAAWNGLYADQKHAAQVTLTSRDWITAIEGYAGSTKTTTIGAIRQFAEGRGFTVRGFGPTRTSVQALEGAGIEATTVDSLIRGALPKKNTRELWVVDESSLLDSLKYNQLVRTARRHGVERLVFVGDQNQIEAIGAGAPLRQLLAAGLTVANLDTIRRQTDAGLRRVVELTISDPVASIGLLESQGRLHEITDEASRRKAISAEYLRAYQAGKKTLVVSAANEDRKNLNATIRADLVADGRVEKQGHEQKILVHRDLTQEEQRHAQNYQPGDVLRFNIGNWRISKGAHLTVAAVDPARNKLILRTGLGFTRINPARWDGIEAYTQEQRTLAVGDRIQFRANLNKRGIANGEFGTVLKLGYWTKVRFDDGRKLTLKPGELLHIDHGYASTAHSAQGSTVDHVIMNVDCSRGEALVNQRSHYVGISRAREDAQIFTDSISGLQRALAKKTEKDTALDAIGVSLAAKSRASPALPAEQHQAPRRVSGFRFRLSAGSG
jgi:conjugative relaxase-like TrwC/TraI family protein